MGALGRKADDAAGREIRLDVEPHFGAAGGHGARLLVWYDE